MSGSLEAVVSALMNPKWWEDEEKYSSTSVTMVQTLSREKIAYLRNVKSSLGPAKFRLRLWTTQWVERERDNETATVVSHAFDDLDKCHLIDRFVCSVDKERPGCVLVRFEELTSSPKIAIKVARNKVKKVSTLFLFLLAPSSTCGVTTLLFPSFSGSFTMAAVVGVGGGQIHQRAELE